MRKHYLDNLKIIVILLLFPIHTFMIWNNYGTKFYVWAGENNLLSSLMIITNPWNMALLFVIAGMCARYSLKKRNTREFIKERINKLLVPLILGVLLLIPIQTLYARKFFDGYDGSIWENYGHFFTNFTDLSGYDGGFSPGHLWFILFLLIISLLALLVMKYAPYEKISAKFEKMNIFGIILLFIPVWLMSYLGAFGTYSLGRYLALYLLGYYTLSNDVVMDKIMRNKKVILGLFGVLQLGLVVVYYNFGYYGDLLVNLVGWMGVLAGMVIGRLLLDTENKVTRYFRRASFPIYILHLPILVVIAYYAVMIDNVFLQIGVIILGSFAVTVLVYEIVRRVPILRKMIGVR